MVDGNMDTLALFRTKTNESGAFEKVPHKRIIKKLEGYGIQGNVLI